LDVMGRGGGVFSGEVASNGRGERVGGGEKESGIDLRQRLQASKRNVNHIVANSNSRQQSFPTMRDRTGRRGSETEIRRWGIKKLLHKQKRRLASLRGMNLISSRDRTSSENLARKPAGKRGPRGVSNFEKGRP